MANITVGEKIFVRLCIGGMRWNGYAEIIIVGSHGLTKRIQVLKKNWFPDLKMNPGVQY